MRLSGDIAMHPYLYWKLEEAKSPWHFIQATPEAMLRARQAGAMFFTYTRFSHEPGNGLGEPTRYGDLVLDFDSKADPAEALQDMRALCLQHLPEQYGLEPHAIKFFVSGSKGYHAVIPEWAFGHPEGHVKLPLLYKWIVQRITRTLPLRSLDMSLYCMGRGKMFRLSGVRRANGRFKVPIGLQEAMQLSAAELDELTAQPRRIEAVDIDRQPAPALKELWELAAREVEDLEAARSEPMSKEQLSQISEAPPPCIAHILANHPPKTAACNFNRAVMLLCNYYQDIGVGLEQALAACREFVHGYPFSDSYNTPQLRLQHFEAQWRYMLEHAGYFFSCGRAHGLKLPREAYDCVRCIGLPVVESVGNTSDRAEEADDGRPYPDFPYEVMLGHAGFSLAPWAQSPKCPRTFCS